MYTGRYFLSETPIFSDSCLDAIRTWVDEEAKAAEYTPKRPKDNTMNGGPYHVYDNEFIAKWKKVVDVVDPKNSLHKEGND
jgi:hypothetical protein